ncbi:MAG: septum formation initiator family protein [Nitrospirae bacterium]|nr:septum formation initiator family protein [Nitrospirota bacterium]
MNARGRRKVPRGGRWLRSNRPRGEAARRDRLVQVFTLAIGLPLLGWLVVTLLFGGHGFLASSRMADHHERLSRDIASIEAENATLRQEIERLKKDPLTIEALARERLGMGRRGEIVYRFDEPSAAAR